MEKNYNSMSETITRRHSKYPLFVKPVKKSSGDFKVSNLLYIEKKNELDLINLILTASSLAVSSNIFINLLLTTGLTSGFLSEIFEITNKTFIKYKKENHKLPIRLSEMAVKLHMLYISGSGLFGSVDNFNKWLNEKSYGLNDTKPIDMLNTVTGIDAVSDELKRIEYGATA